jgi:hypothetical protein
MPVPQLRESEADVSSWSDFTDSLIDLGTAGYETYKDATTPATTPATTAADKSSSPSWLMPALIVVGLVVAGLVFVGLSRK